MSDRFVMSANFKYGLDTRRAALLELPGAMIQCQNGFVNSGGGVEQRMSFVKQANAYPVGTFGLEVTQSGLVTFGSTLPAPGPLPTGVSYASCSLPPGNLAGTIPSMTSVVFSCNYNGQAFVLAKFDNSDGKTFAFYGDQPTMTLVGEVTWNGFGFGLGAGSLANSELAGQLATLLNNFSTSFTATPNEDENGVAVVGDVKLVTQPGVHAGFTPSQTTAGGTLQATLISQNNPGVNAQSAVATFYITGGVATNTIDITAPLNSDGTGTVDITGGAITWDTDIATTVAKVISAVNTLTGTTGYTASADLSDDSVVIINAPIAWGTLPNAPYHITVTTVGITTSPGPAVAFTCSITPSVLFGLYSYPTSGSGAYYTITASAQTVGLIGTASYQWTLLSVVNGTIPFAPTDGASCTFGPATPNFLGHSAGTIRGIIRLTVTDSNTGFTATADSNVIFQPI